MFHAVALYHLDIPERPQMPRNLMRYLPLFPVGVFLPAEESLRETIAPFAGAGLEMPHAGSALDFFGNCSIIKNINRGVYVWH
jgi:hypothetical protein